MNGNDKAQIIISAGVLVICFLNAIMFFSDGDISKGVVCLLITALFGAIILNKKLTAKNKSSKPAEPAENVQPMSIVKPDTAPTKSVRSCDDTSDVKPVVHSEDDFVIDKFGRLTEYRGTATDVIIPDNVKRISGLRKCNVAESLNYSTDIWEWVGAFAFREDISSVTIPEGVTGIGGSAFEGCTGLSKIAIPASVNGIDVDAFKGCTGLTEVILPAGIRYILESAFAGCTGLTEITIPHGVTKIDLEAFSGCTGLTKVTIPNSVTEIGEWAFSGCTGLTEVTVWGKPEGVFADRFSVPGCRLIYPDGSKYKGLSSVCISDGTTSIGAYEFANYTNLISVTLPEGVTEIGKQAFKGCTGLTSVTLPDSVEKIEQAAFRGCTHIQTVTIPHSVTKIGKLAFADCTGLTKVTIPDSVTEIGEWAFADCTGLTKVTIPNSVTEIGKWAFSGCTGLTEIKIYGRPDRFNALAFDGCNCRIEYVCRTKHVRQEQTE